MLKTVAKKNYSRDNGCIRQNKEKRADIPLLFSLLIPLSDRVLTLRRKRAIHLKILTAKKCVCIYLQSCHTVYKLVS